MAASLTVPQLLSAHNPAHPSALVPRRGVLTLFGYGIKVKLDRGHLVIEDGIGPHRRIARLPRIGHGLRRLVVIGSDGMVSLAALRWLADQKAAFVMLNRNGSVLLVTGPAGPRDARLRRAQALAFASGVAVALSRDLIEKKLAAQERNARTLLENEPAADAIRATRERLSSASTITESKNSTEPASQHFDFAKGTLCDLKQVSRFCVDARDADRSDVAEIIRRALLSDTSRAITTKCQADFDGVAVRYEADFAVQTHSSARGPRFGFGEVRLDRSGEGTVALAVWSDTEAGTASQVARRFGRDLNELFGQIAAKCRQ